MYRVLLLLIPSVTSFSFGTDDFIPALNQFEAECWKDNNNGDCLLKCRNRFKGAEASDCSTLTFSSFNATLYFHFSPMLLPSSMMKPLMDSMKSLHSLLKKDDPLDIWKREMERRIREASGVEARLEMTSKQISAAGDRSFDRFHILMKSGGSNPEVQPSELPFIFTIPVCDNCSTVADIINKMEEKLAASTDTHMEYVPVWPKPKPLLSSGQIALLATVVALLAVCILITLISRYDKKDSIEETNNKANEVQERRPPIPTTVIIPATPTDVKPYIQTTSKTAVYGKAEKEECESLADEPGCSLNRPD